VTDPAHRFSWRVFTTHSNDALADILCEIAYALDLTSNPQDRNNLPKVTGYRLTQCNDLNRPFLNFALHDVDRGVSANYTLRATAIASRQSGDRLDNLPLGQPTHLCDCPSEFPRSESKILAVCAGAMVMGSTQAVACEAKVHFMVIRCTREEGAGSTLTLQAMNVSD
jgi:hypothetical protein